MLPALKRTYSKPRNVFWGIVIFTVLTLLVILIQNIPNLRNIFSSDLLSFGDKMNTFFTSYLTFFTNYDLFGQASILLMAFLMSINLILVKEYWKRQYTVKKALNKGGAALSSIGLVIGLLGVGCASCGGVLLALIFGTGMTTFLATKFPLGGLEISIVSILIILYSNYYVLKKLSRPNVC